MKPRLQIKPLFFYLLHCTWCLPQTFVGSIMFLFLINRRHFIYHGTIATFWHNKTSASLGLFLFLSDTYDAETLERIQLHEYGHTIQSILLGPFYLAVISLPSMLWCYLPICRNFRSRHGMSYYSFYTERTADILGEWSRKNSGTA